MVGVSVCGEHHVDVLGSHTLRSEIVEQPTRLIVEEVTRSRPKASVHENGLAAGADKLSAKVAVPRIRSIERVRVTFLIGRPALLTHPRKELSQRHRKANVGVRQLDNLDVTNA